MKTKWFAFGCLTSIALVVLFFVLSINYLMNNSNVKQNIPIDNNSWLYVNLSGELSEYNTLKDDFFNVNPYSANEIISKIKAAKSDPQIKGIVLETKFVSTGYATAHELILALQDFRKSGKKVYAYIDMASNKDYLISTAADQICLNPSSSAGIILTGVGSNIMFYKTLLDKIGIDMNIIKAGKYKGYGETYSRNNMSPELQSNLSSLFQDVYTRLLSDIAQNRKMDVAKIKEIYEQRPDMFITGENALKYQLVDKLCYRDDLYKNLGIHTSNLVSLSRYNKMLTNNSSEIIAVLYAQGDITPVAGNYATPTISSKEFNKTLADLEKDVDVRAVVLRIDSPGGSALESDIIWDKLRKLKSSKPLIVSMGDVAASGGYYIACNADYIFADPYTITGSIGVISAIPNFNRLSGKIGVNSQSVGYGKYASFLDPWQKAKPEELQSMQLGVMNTYNEFKTRVADGRKLSMDEVETVAQGRVWSSTQAKENRLVDEIGTLDMAIKMAAKLSKTVDYATEFYPTKQSLLEIIFKDKFDFQNLAKVFVKPNMIEKEMEKSLKIYNQLNENPIQTVLPLEINN